MEHQTLFSNSFLRSVWSHEFKTFVNSETHKQLKLRLKTWAARKGLNETSASSTFISEFFEKTWNYYGDGQCPETPGYTYHPSYPVPHAGQRGGTGYADLASGWFGDSGYADTPQVLIEFKDIRSGLDNPQNRKGNTRSPVKQCADYLLYSRNEYYGNQTILPSWGIVTDMNEFRLYHWKNIPERFQRFIVKGDGQETDLISDNTEADFLRFVFWKMFHIDTLLTKNSASSLGQLLKNQFIHEKEIEKDFYKEYQAFRKHVYETLVIANPDFPGTKGKLVRLTQRFLDRCIFLFFCEDKGEALDFPQNLFRDLLIEMSTSDYVNRDDNAAWSKVKMLFTHMRDGGVFGKNKINRFNGGLFKEDPDLEGLKIPTKIFFEPGQGAAGVDSIAKHPKTVLYLSAMYNFGTVEKGNRNAINLYTLGRIFEQSITELEIMEAEAEGRESINTLSKRKRDGVYYTPEWVVESIIDEVIGEKFLELRKETGLNEEISENDALYYRTGAPTIDGSTQEGDYTPGRKGQITKYVNALRAYENELQELKIVDPSCGSGAFLIKALEKLMNERKWISDERARITGTGDLFDQDTMIKSLLSSNIYGVDINSESVEIARLALWLHTALPGKPLSTLDDNILCGNSLVGNDFYSHHQNKSFDDEKIEQINAFDWEKAFPDVFKRHNGGFDCVIGNPPYVKLQNFRMVSEDVADYLLNAKAPDGSPVYASTQTGNFDLYLPFIERGLGLLRANGRMGYIAPSVWLRNDYGEGLRKQLANKKSLYSFIDFGCFQVFDEATTYTALQFFSNIEHKEVEYVAAHKKEDVFQTKSNTPKISYAEFESKQRWNLSPADEMALICRLSNEGHPLSSNHITSWISQGLISGAFNIFANEKNTEGNHTHQITPKKKCIVNLDKELLLPLVSGEDIRAFANPVSRLDIIFPYEIDDNGKHQLISPENMASSYSDTWLFLKSYESFLRQRDSGKLDDVDWYRYSRNQNLDKQNKPKILVAGTAKQIRATYDFNGDVAVNDKRVYMIAPSEEIEPYFLVAYLNSRIATFIFRRFARPKLNNYFDVETQFLAPIPVPNVKSEKTADELKQLGLELSKMHTERIEKFSEIERRLHSSEFVVIKHELSWFWAEYKTWREFAKEAPPEITGRKPRNDWGRKKHDEWLAEHFFPINNLLVPGARISAKATDDEVELFVNGKPVLSKFLLPDEAKFVAAQWRQIARRNNVTNSFDGKKLVTEARTLREGKNEFLITCVIKLEQQLSQLEADIITAQQKLDKIIFDEFNMSDDEIELVMSDEFDICPVIS